MKVLSRSGPADIVDQVLAAEEERLAAMRAADADALAPLLADDLRFVFSSGEVDGREGILAAIRSGKLRYGDHLDLEDVEIRAYPGAAVLVGVLRIHVLLPDKELLARNRFTMHWSRGPHGWQLVSWQSTGMKE